MTERDKLWYTRFETVLAFAKKNWRLPKTVDNREAYEWAYHTKVYVDQGKLAKEKMDYIRRVFPLFANPDLSYSEVSEQLEDMKIKNSIPKGEKPLSEVMEVVSDDAISGRVAPTRVFSRESIKDYARKGIYSTEQYIRARMGADNFELSGLDWNVLHSVYGGAYTPLGYYCFLMFLGFYGKSCSDARDFLMHEYNVSGVPREDGKVYNMQGIVGTVEDLLTRAMLPERELYTLCARFCLGYKISNGKVQLGYGGTIKTFKEIGRAYNRTVQRACGLYDNAIRKVQGRNTKNMRISDYTSGKVEVGKFSLDGRLVGRVIDGKFIPDYNWMSEYVRF
jgi:hypothetical protein